MRKSLSFTAVLVGTAILGIAVILAVTLIPSPVPSKPIPGLGVSVEYSVSDHRLSSAELTDNARVWRSLDGAPLTVPSQYAYARFSLTNAGDSDMALIVQNDTRNYYTSFLSFDGRVYTTRFRQGDPVPSGESPLRHIRAAFPVSLPPGTSTQFVLEYMNERDIVVDPDVREATQWFTEAGIERDIVIFISASVLCLTLMNLIAGLALFRPELVRMSFLTFSLLFFFARQSRLLLVIFSSQAYAPWLYPLSIAFELVSAHIFFGYLMGENFRPWQRWAYRILSALTVFLTAVSFFGAAYTVADVLNVFAMITLLIVLVGVLTAARRRDAAVLQIMLAFAPWILTMAVEIVIIYIKPRQIFLADYRQAFGMLFSLILVTVTSIRTREREAGERILRLGAELAEARRCQEANEGKIREERVKYRSRLAADCEAPLVGIFAAVGTLQREYSDPGVVAAADLIVTEASRIGDALGSRDPSKGGLA